MNAMNPHMHPTIVSHTIQPDQSSSSVLHSSMEKMHQNSNENGMLSKDLCNTFSNSPYNLTFEPHSAPLILSNGIHSQFTYNDNGKCINQLGAANAANNNSSNSDMTQLSAVESMSTASSTSAISHTSQDELYHEENVNINPSKQFPTMSKNSTSALQGTAAGMQDTVHENSRYPNSQQGEGSLSMRKLQERFMDMEDNDSLAYCLHEEFWPTHRSQEQAVNALYCDSDTILQDDADGHDVDVFNTMLMDIPTSADECPNYTSAANSQHSFRNGEIQSHDHSSKDSRNESNMVMERSAVHDQKILNSPKPDSNHGQPVNRASTASPGVSYGQQLLLSSMMHSVENVSPLQRSDYMMQGTYSSMLKPQQQMMMQHQLPLNMLNSSSLASGNYNPLTRPPNLMRSCSLNNIQQPDGPAQILPRISSTDLVTGATQIMLRRSSSDQSMVQQLSAAGNHTNIAYINHIAAASQGPTTSVLPSSVHHIEQGQVGTTLHHGRTLNQQGMKFMQQTWTTEKVIQPQFGNGNGNGMANVSHTADPMNMANNLYVNNMQKLQPKPEAGNSIANTINSSSSSSSSISQLKVRRRHGTATDPQSIAARTRREKFSERIRMLQSLVPNGERLDTVSMLGQTLEYIRFLQHQVWELYHGPENTSPLPPEKLEKWKDFMEAHSTSTSTCTTTTTTTN